jgi:hypothetical protein
MGLVLGMRLEGWMASDPAAAGRTEAFTFFIFIFKIPRELQKPNWSKVLGSHLR